jgi:hypothetical protein
MAGTMTPNPWLGTVRARRATAAMRYAVALAVAVVTLTGCGGMPPPRSSPPVRETLHAATVALCRSVGQLDRLEVVRREAIPQDRIRFAFPATVSVTRRPAVRAFAAALCRLPTLPRGAVSCPADLGVTYLLTFSGHAQRFPSVIADRTGCEPVRGLGPTRWGVPAPAVWHALGVALGLRHPDAEAPRER